jgi:hypothetical protein
MKLRDQISAFFSRDKQPDVTPPTTAKESEQAVTPSPLNLSAAFRADQDRTARIATCNEMYETDPRAEAVIDTLARDTVSVGYSVQCAQSQEVTDLLTALTERLKLTSTVDDWLRESFIEGESFLELGVSAAMQVEEVTRKPTLGMNRNSNKFDRFEDPARAFWYSEALGQITRLTPPDDAVWFAQWQIVHARWKRRTSQRYGRPLFASAISAWRRVTEAEINMAVRRMTRAGLRYHHFVQGDASAVEAYKVSNRAALNDPLAAITDFFGNTQNGITAIQGDARLNEIDDVLHHLETWWTASPVPMTLIGYGKDINRDILEQKLEQYDRALAQITQWCEIDILRPIMDTELLLHGLLPETAPYDLIWKSKQQTTAGDLDKIADAILKLKGLGVPDDLLWSIVARYLPWLDVEAIISGIETDGQADRLADNSGAEDQTTEEGDQA